VVYEQILVAYGNYSTFKQRLQRPTANSWMSAG